MNTAEYLLLFTLIMIGIPLLTYLTVKLGRYAYLQATKLFNEDQQEDNKKG